MKNGLHIDSDGTKRWFKEGKCHREDGRAIEYADGSKRWYINGVPHREDGPAVEWVNGSAEWWLNDVFLGYNARGFWTLWNQLTPEQQNNLNLHMWLAKYMAKYT